MITINPTNESHLEHAHLLSILPLFLSLSDQERLKLKEMLEAKKRDIRKDIQFWMLDHPNDSPEYLYALIEMHTHFNGALDLITNFEATNK